MTEAHFRSFYSHKDVGWFYLVPINNTDRTAQIGPFATREEADESALRIYGKGKFNDRDVGARTSRSTGTRV